MRGGDACIWRGEWLEDGVRAAGVVVPETSFAASDQDALTGLLDRRSFVRRAREQLQAAGGYSLVVADLDRLRRLNEALGHERADLVLAALGLSSRLAIAFPAPCAPRPCRRGRVRRARARRHHGARRRADAPGHGTAPRAWPASTSSRPFPSGRSRRTAAPTRRTRPNCSGGPRSPSSSGQVRRAWCGAPSTAGRSRATASRAWRWSPTCAARSAAARSCPSSSRSSASTPGPSPASRRWRAGYHPRRGVLTPEEFLPLCEEMGLLIELGGHMMRESEALLARPWSSARADHRAAGEISVSASISRPARSTAISWSPTSRPCSRRPACRAAMLKLEITESDIMREPAAVAVILHQLRGCRRGPCARRLRNRLFSSLQYLTRLPFDTLKIDRYFVRTYGHQ